MSMLPDVFNPEDEDDDPFKPLPAGWYLAEIFKSKLTPTKDKKGKYLDNGYTILEGEFKGRKVYGNINLVNASDMAVRIGRADLKKICVAVGHEGELEETEDLFGIPLCIKLSVKEATSQWPAKNEVKNFAHESQLEELNGE